MAHLDACELLLGKDGKAKVLSSLVWDKDIVPPHIKLDFKASKVKQFFKKTLFKDSLQ